MKFKGFAAIAVSLAFLSGCAMSTRVYYWQRHDTGATQFAEDHKMCIYNADWFPWDFKMARMWPFTSETLDLRLRLENGGIWGNFVPYEGAQSIFVNSSTPSKTVLYGLYSKCMRDHGYTERKKHTGPIKY